MAALCNKAGHYIFALWFPSFFFLFSSPNLSGRRLDVYHTSTQWRGLSANLECRSETCCMRFAGNAGRKKSPKFAVWASSLKFVGLYLRNYRHVSTIRKTVKQQYLPTCPHNTVNFGLLVAQTVSLVWGTPAANSTGFASWHRYCTAL